MGANIGQDDTGKSRRDTDTRNAQLRAQGFKKTGHCKLGRAIGRAPGNADQPSQGRNGHDAAARGFEVGQGGMGTPDAAPQVHPHQLFIPMQVRRLNLRKQSLRRDAGVINQPIDAAPVLDGLINQFLALALNAHIRRNHQARCA